MTLLPTGNISVTGSGSSRTVSMTPATNKYGSATVTLTVSDGSKTRSDSFVLTVNAVNDTPTITNIGNQSINEDTAKSVNFTVTDIETADGSLSVSRYSSNTTLLPTSNISITGSGSSRTVHMTPATNKSGSATITLTVSDGSLTRTDSFVLTVNPANDAPSISGNPSSQVYTNNEFTFTPSSSDADGDNLSFSITNKPSWLAFNSSTGSLSGTPTQSHVGNYNNIQITVSDNSLSTSLSPFNLSVLKPPQVSIEAIPNENGFSNYVPATPNLIGEIKGQSSVDGGAFTYNIPIAVAPGRTGMQPSISLNYNSQSGSGLAGYGWSLSASESISRCSSIHDIDKTTKAVTFSTEDKLCYNGSRMLAHSGQYGISGTVYVLERNSQVFITQSGSLNSTSASFSLERLNGSVSTFGTSSNSRVVLNGLTATLSWLKDVDEDTSGNQIEYVYSKEVGTNLIQDIYYTGFNGSRGNRQVHFNYTDIDKTTTYQWGGKSEHDKLLTSIDVKIDSVLKSKWKLGHESFGTTIDELDVANKLSTLSYCDGQDLTSCISSSFNFYKTPQSYSETSNTLLNQYDNDNYNTGVRVKREKDYDGDGTPDLVGPEKIYLSRGGVLALADLPVRHVFNANGDYDSDNRARQNNISSNFFTGDMDFNRDGRSDFLYMDDNNNIIIAWLDENHEISDDYENTGIDSTCYGYNPQYASDRLCRSMATDFNGDGNADLFVATNYDTSSGSPTVTYKAYLNTGSSFEYKAEIDANIGLGLQLIDVDGDGLSDFAPSAPQDGFTWYKAHWNPNTESLSFTSHQVSINVDYNTAYRIGAGQWADFNGDGLQDILTLDLVNSTDYSYTWVIAFNKGDGQFSAPVNTGLRELAWSGKGGAIAKAGTGRVYNQHVRIFDYNNDGRQDILIPDNTRRKYTYECWNWNSNEACAAVDGDEFPKLHDFDVWYWNVLITQPDGTSFLEKELDVYGALSTLSVADYNADGWSDFISGLGYESDASQRTWWYTGTKAKNNSPKIGYVAFIHNQDRQGFNLESISTGRGEKLSLDYDILENVRPVDFTPILSTPEGYINFGSTMRVVNELNVDNGIGGQNTTTYAYGNARFHKAGRGFQGFGEIVETDLQRGIETTTAFSQIFPWSGMVNSVEKRDTTSNIVLSSYSVNEAYPSLTEYQAALYANPAGASMCFYPKDTTSTKYLNNGSGGAITQSTNTATTDVITTQNQLCQVSGLDTTQVDDTVTVVKEVLQTYTSNMPWVTTSTVSSTYNTVHEIVADGAPAASTVDTVKTVTYNDRKLPDTVTLAGGNAGTGSNGVGATTIIEYDGYGNKNKVTNTIEGGSGTEANARSVSYFMDNEHYFVERTQNNEWGAVNVSNNEYDALTGQVTESTDVNGFVTTREIDFLGAEHSLTVRNSAGQQVAPTQYTEYDWGSVTKVQDGAPTVTTFIDTLGRDYRQTSQGFDGSIITTETVYDAEGQVVAEITPTASFGTHQSVTYGSYDVLGRPASKTVNDGNISFTSDYSYNGFTTTIDVRAGIYLETMSRSYNSLNQLLQTVDANEQATYFAYNAAGLPVYIRDVIDSEITAGYDNLGRKEYFDDPNMGRWDFTYNEFGEVATQTDAKDVDTVYVYDKLGRLENRANRRFIYDNAGKGRLYQSSFDGKTETYGYDSKGRIDQVTTVIDGTTFYQHFAYDSYYGRVKAQEFASGERVAYRYNQYGYLTEEYQKYTDGSESRLRLITEMSALGAVKQQRFGNGLTQTFDFLDSGAINGICTGTSTGCNGTNVQNLGYFYDDMGNLTEQHNYMLGFKEAYSYDALHRVDDATISVNGFGKGVIDYDYDDAGNFIFKTDYGTNYQYGSSNRASTNSNAGPNAVRQLTRTNGSGVVNFAYDNNGNMTNGDGLTIDYNRDNKPVEIIRSGVTSTFNYDAEGMRYKQVVGNGGSNTTTTYYIDKTVERQIKKSGGTTTEILDKTYVAGHTILFTPVLGEFTGQSRIVHTLHDRLGGVDTLLDGSRHLNEVSAPNFLVQQRRGYDIFGRPRDLTADSFAINSSSNLLSDWQEIKRGFTSHEHLPESELIHMNGRVYDYNVGRFLGVDPFLQFPENSQSANPYSYIMNNPMAGTDPTGYACTMAGSALGSCGGAEVTASSPGGEEILDKGFAGFGKDKSGNTFVKTSDGSAYNLNPVKSGETNGSLGASSDSASEVGKPDAHSVITGTIEPIVGSAVKGYIKTLVNGFTFGIVYGDISSIQSLNADPEDRADMEAYEAQAGLEKYATMALPGNAPNNIIKSINPKALISRQGRNEMTGSKIKRIRKSMKSGGYDESQPIDVADVNGKMIIIDGHHRAAAASAAQLKKVPVRIKKVSQQDANQLLIEAAEAKY